jgi:lambda family phage minor tail protein L
VSDIITAVQKQDPGSELVILYDLEYESGSFAYFTPNQGDIEFRDSTGTAQAYTSMPIETDGFDISSDGAYSRPTLTVANISSVFSDAIGIEYEELIGQRITRRVTLKKYLVGESEDSGAGNAPVEYPKTTYIIDRIKERNILQVTFELAAPFDLAGMTLPKRQIIGGGCPWRYKGANASVTLPNKVGGCTWNSSITLNGTTYPIYVNSEDEYIVPTSISFTAFSGSATAGSYYSTTNSSPSFSKVNSDGSLSSVSSITEYWQCIQTTTSTPAESDVRWRRVRTYSTYSGSTAYSAYTDTDYNDYVVYSNEVWKVKNITQDADDHESTPEANAWWTRGDACGKKITSCSLRFHAIPDTNGGATQNNNRNVSLPFGGFPASRQYR